MLAILSAMLVMMESGSVDTGRRLQLTIDRSVARIGLEAAEPVRQPPEGPLRPGRALSDCNLVMAGLEPADRLARSQDLLACRAVMMKDEPVGRSFLWLLRRAGVQAELSASRLVLNVRFAP